MYMALSVFRKFHSKVRASESFPFELHESLSGKKVLVVEDGKLLSMVSSLDIVSAVADRA